MSGKGKALYSWQDTAIEFVPISILDPSEDSPRCDSLVAQQRKEVLLGIYRGSRLLKWIAAP